MEKGIQLSTELVRFIHALNRRTADKLAARIYFYYARFHELKGDLASIRANLLATHRSATLRRDDESQATLLNILVRSYYASNLYEQAHKLLAKSTFPESVSNNQFVRHMYYLGRINALQLDYTSAHQHILQAVRKAPQNAAAAGFLQAVHKLALIVQLLMGDLPDRATFRLPMLRLALVPYLHITQAVRVGDLAKFQSTLAQYHTQFQQDNNYNLILRLRHNVIKTGIRMISLSYSKISLRDICFKLQLDSEQDAEYIVAKAIRDGVIDAEINHEDGYIQSKENVDVYSTQEPMDAFHQRISFCLNLHNDSVKAMRFPMNFHHPELEFAEEARERERELVKEINEADMDDDSNMEY
ncbi:26S proteasome non-ATPase regulatory subunit [Entomophthora muscae]|uniref:26S proteasome non-ATPase regulatory subunit n=2 Tax=Entomophthora muscae TaxID=34485 RepID=A0ACC2T073_9FUNG|nr:26S proteasome non-ATPase regulatory subunit [Entomophthora muscae]